MSAGLDRVRDRFNWSSVRKLRSVFSHDDTDVALATDSSVARLGSAMNAADSIDTAGGQSKRLGNHPLAEHQTAAQGHPAKGSFPRF